MNVIPEVEEQVLVPYLRVKRRVHFSDKAARIYLGQWRSLFSLPSPDSRPSKKLRPFISASLDQGQQQEATKSARPHQNNVTMTFTGDYYSPFRLKTATCIKSKKHW